MSRTIAYSNVKYIAHNETDIREADSMIEQLSEIKILAAESILLISKIRSQKGWNL